MSLVRRLTPLRGAVAGGLFAVLIGACGGPGSAPLDSVWPFGPSGAGASAQATAPPADLNDPAGLNDVVPPEPQPVADQPCPYLDEATVESINGQRVGSVRISADQPHPACFFHRGDGAEQLRTRVVVGTPQVARAIVDAAAPVATSNLAELPGGWSGGSQPTSDGVVFAVARHGTAVVVTTNQPHVLGARRIAEQVIAALGL